MKIVEIYGLSPLQHGLLFHALDEPGMYNVQLQGELVGHVDPGAFRRAWQRVVERHTILRTCFAWKSVREPRQAVFDRVDLPWREDDLRAIGEREQQDRLRILAENERAPFAL